MSQSGINQYKYWICSQLPKSDTFLGSHCTEHFETQSLWIYSQNASISWNRHIMFLSCPSTHAVLSENNKREYVFTPAFKEQTWQIEVCAVRIRGSLTKFTYSSSLGVCNEVLEFVIQVAAPTIKTERRQNEWFFQRCIVFVVYFTSCYLHSGLLGLCEGLFYEWPEPDVDRHSCFRTYFFIASFVSVPVWCLPKNEQTIGAGQCNF